MLFSNQERAFIIAMTPPQKAAVFRSALGWIGVAFCGPAVIRLTFGHPSKQTASDELHATPLHAIHTLSKPQQLTIHRVRAFAEGAEDDFLDVPVELPNVTDFQRRVLAACRQIPYGSTRSYADLARQAGRPRAARAVGTTMARNPVALVIPCHRVVSSARHGCGGFSAPGGVEMKRRLLALESQLF